MTLPTGSAKVLVLGNPYLVDNIIFHSGWCSLIAFTHGPTPVAEAAKKEIRRRIVEVLRPFVPPPAFDRFFQCIDTTNAIITGSVVRRLLLLNERVVTPFDLNILAPPLGEDTLHTFLITIGYSRRTAPPAACYAKGVKEVDHYERIAADGQVSV
ncbi:hypothetical protein MD484_g6188, partial [Candolleomyces efflorescens]